MAAVVFAANNKIAQHAQINNIIWPMDTFVFRADIFFFSGQITLSLLSPPLFLALSHSISISLCLFFSLFFIIRYIIIFNIIISYICIMYNVCILFIYILFSIITWPIFCFICLILLCHRRVESRLVVVATEYTNERKPILPKKKRNLVRLLFFFFIIIIISSNWGYTLR